VISHPDENREIFKYHEFVEERHTYRWFYDRKEGSTSTECKDKKLWKLKQFLV
jgi:hypothetical protein